jgi:hypothetical protein
MCLKKTNLSKRAAFMDTILFLITILFVFLVLICVIVLASRRRRFRLKAAPMVIDYTELAVVLPETVKSRSGGCDEYCDANQPTPSALNTAAPADDIVIDPPSGYCGKLKTSDPRVFGPPIWTAFHIMAQNYPYIPTEETKESARAFISGIARMVPCGKCGRHFSNFIQYNEDHAGQQDMQCGGTEGDTPCMSMDEVVHNREGMIRFFTAAHNNVSEKTNPERARFTPSDSNAFYTTMQLCTKNEIWGGEPLDRHVGNDESWKR